MSIIQPQNSPLNFDVFIHRNRVKRALVDGGASLNIFTLNLVKVLGYAEDVIDPRKKITIKAYDDKERSSKGMVILPIKVGPVVKEIICQVLDLQLTYKILLQRPWIHDMQAISSTYHQCLKFTYMGQEVTILGDQHFDQYCNSLIPHNREETDTLTDNIN